MFSTTRLPYEPKHPQNEADIWLNNKIW